MRSKLLIKGGTVWDGETFSKKDVLIKDGFIVDVSPNVEDGTSDVFNAENMIVSSGLIDSHVHLKGTSTDDIGIESPKISFPFGVTMLIDASAEQGTLQELMNMNCDIRVFVVVGIINNKADFSFAEKMMAEYKEKVIGLKVYFDETLVEAWDITPLIDICEYSAKNNLQVMVHTTNSPASMYEIVNVLNSGDIISHAFHGGKNNACCDDFVALKRAKEKGIYIDAALSAYYHIDYSVFKKAVENGYYPDIISSDITKELEFVGNEKYGLPICMSILEELGLDKCSTFKAVTVNPAKIFRLENKGSLKVGNIADIAVFKLKDGEVILKDRQNNKIELKQFLKCVLTVAKDEIKYIDY